MFGLTNIPEMKARSKHLLKTMKKKKISVGHVLGFDALDSDICSAAAPSSSCMYVCMYVCMHCMNVYKCMSTHLGYGRNRDRVLT